MHRIRSRNVLDTFVAETREIDPAEQVLARSEQRWCDRDVKLVDKAGTQILLNRRSAAANSDVLAARCLARAFKSRLDSVGHKVKHRAALHRDRGASMMS